MRAGLIGRKLGMTRMFTEDGQCLPVTVLKMGPCQIVSKRTETDNGYNAIQLCFEEMKPSRVKKPQKGQYAKANLPAHRLLREFRVSNPDEYELGQALTVEQFEVKGYVDISGKSIGKGFSGGMKRWGFRGGRASHGAHKTHRSLGSIGQCQTPGRVFKNKKMAGQMGDKKVTVQNVEIAHVDTDNNLLVVKGSVPGSKGAVVIVRDAGKKNK